jgi:hypothetical protein
VPAEGLLAWIALRIAAVITSVARLLLMDQPTTLRLNFAAGVRQSWAIAR